MDLMGFVVLNQKRFARHLTKTTAADCLLCYPLRSVYMKQTSENIKTPYTNFGTEDSPLNVS